MSRGVREREFTAKGMGGREGEGGESWNIKMFQSVIQWSWLMLLLAISMSRLARKREHSASISNSWLTSDNWYQQPGEVEVVSDLFSSFSLPCNEIKIKIVEQRCNFSIQWLMRVKFSLSSNQNHITGRASKTGRVRRLLFKTWNKWDKRWRLTSLSPDCLSSPSQSWLEFWKLFF